MEGSIIMIGPRERRFRDHAEEARTLERMLDPTVREQMLHIAEDFDRYAVSAAKMDEYLSERGIVNNSVNR
jgi:hypothetical protein